MAQSNTHDGERLPEGWVWVTVGDISKAINSGFPCGKHNTDGVGIPHLRPMNISPHGEIDLSLVKYVEVEDYDALQAGDVLFNNTNSPAWLGKTAYIKQDSEWAYSNHMTRIRLHAGPNSAWVAYSLYYLFLTGYFRMHCRHHVNQASINATFLADRVSVPLPPASEQQRIVAEIETQVTRLEAGVAALKRAQANLRRYKASVLKAACEGRLLPPDEVGAIRESPDYEPADVLLERILAERRTKWEAENPGKKYKEPKPPDTSELPGVSGIPEGWTWATAEQLSDETRSITYGVIKLGAAVEDGIPVLRSSDVRHLRLDLGGVKRISAEVANNYKRTFLQGGEILVTVRGTLGGVVVVPEECKGYNISREVAMLALTEDRIGECVALFVGSKPIQNWLMGRTRGIAYTGINIGTLKQAPIPIPPLSEQHRIVAEAERRLSVVAELEKQVEAALRRAERLRQAILKHAFEGKLVPQDPNDEPASALLARVKAERSGEGRLGQRNRKVEEGKPEQLTLL